MALVRTLQQRLKLVAALIGVSVSVMGSGWYLTTSEGRAPTAVQRTQQPAPQAASIQAPQTDRPNIVFVLTDDLSTDLLQYMPNVQDLGQRGITFSRFVVTNSLCCPSRASILTGGYPHTTGVLTNGGADGGHPEFRVRHDDQQTYATSLRAAGYTTAMMGKYLNGYRVTDPASGPAATVPPGWNEWYVPGGQDGYSGYDYTLNENGKLVRYGHAATDYLTDVLAAKGADFINRTADAGRPFFLQVSTFGPHAPYTPAPRHATAYPGLTYPRTPAFDQAPTNGPTWLARRKPLTAAAKTSIDQSFRKRAQTALSIDDMVGDLVAALESKGLLENTYVVFSSDNGYHMGEHRLPVGKLTAFETDIRVPLVVAGPGVRGGATSDALAANIDLCPTFEDIAKATRTSLINGHSLLPLLHGEAVPAWRTAVLVEHRRPTTQAEIGPDQESSIANPPSYRALRFRDAVYVEYADGEREYYDIAKDPYQLHNLAPGFSTTRITTLRRSLDAVTRCRGAAACWTAEKAAKSS